MIRVYFSPIVGLPNSPLLEYKFEGQIMEVKYGDKADIFDFSDLPDGHLSSIDVETTLLLNPIISVVKENGVLWIEVLNFITGDATEFEKFPNWIEVE